MSDHPSLHLHRDGPVLTIELARPDTLNALSVPFAEELRDAFRMAEDPGVRAVVLTAQGRAFSSGADLKTLPGAMLASGRPDVSESLRTTFNPLVLQIRALPKPVVAALNGPTVGVAVGIALACDFVVAARSAYLLLAFVNIGLVPDGGASLTVPARVGLGRYNEMALLGGRVDAETAEGWGLVDRLVDDDALRVASLEIAAKLAAGPNGAQAQIKQLVNEGPLAGLPAALALEADLQRSRGESDEFAEGVTAFLQKRAPQFAA